MIVYDIETVCPVMPKEGRPERDIDYARDWSDYARLQPAVIVCKDLLKQQTHVFERTGVWYGVQRIHETFFPWDKLRELVSSRTVIGFNNQGFDDKILHFGGVKPNDSLDLYAMMRKVGGNKGKRGLDLVLAANGLPRKRMSGALAPVLWQRGERDTVTQYCAEDVDAVSDLLDIHHKHGGIYDPACNRRVELEPLLNLFGRWY